MRRDGGEEMEVKRGEERGRLGEMEVGREKGVGWGGGDGGEERERSGEMEVGERGVGGGEMEVGRWK